MVLEGRSRRGRPTSWMIPPPTMPDPSSGRSIQEAAHDLVMPAFMIEDAADGWRLVHHETDILSQLPLARRSTSHRWSELMLGEGHPWRDQDLRDRVSTERRWPGRRHSTMAYPGRPERPGRRPTVRIGDDGRLFFLRPATYWTSCPTHGGDTELAIGASLRVCSGALSGLSVSSCELRLRARSSCADTLSVSATACRETSSHELARIWREMRFHGGSGGP